MSEAKQKAVSIIVEALKLYTTISIAFISGLLTFYGRNITSSYLLLIAVLFFCLAAILSVLTINRFVTQVNKDEIDIYGSSVKYLNFSAAITFGVGLLCGFVFLFYVSSEPIAASSNLKDSQGIIIEKSRIYIGTDVKTRTRIITDANGQIIEVKVNE